MRGPRTASLPARAASMVRCLALFLLLLVPGLQAQEAGISANGRSAEEAVQHYVGTLLDHLSEIQQYYDSDRERYLAEVEEALAEFVDFREAARGVMAKYSAGPRGATAEQLDRFAEVFRSSIVDFYGTALAQYNGEGYEIRGGGSSGDTATVAMMVEGQDGDRYELRYALYLNEDREWRVRNLFVEGVNMRRQYHSQFDSLMARHDYDIDAAIENWDPEPVQ